MLLQTMTYTPQTFTIPELTGISARSIEEHLKLYQGYVRHTNLIHEKIAELISDPEKNAYALGELRRRLGFEYGGMKNHEYYFAQFVGGAQELTHSTLKTKLEERWGSVDAFFSEFKITAMTRGVGWAMLCQDVDTGALVVSWVDEQHLGQLATARIILALDMWEHSYMLDVLPSEKKKYVDAFFQNLNWGVCEERMT
jgi:superoxide dismutase, Fe-Mn family